MKSVGNPVIIKGKEIPVVNFDLKMINLADDGTYEVEVCFGEKRVASMIHNPPTTGLKRWVVAPSEGYDDESFYSGLYDDLFDIHQYCWSPKYGAEKSLFPFTGSLGLLLGELIETIARRTNDV